MHLLMRVINMFRTITANDQEKPINEKPISAFIAWVDLITMTVDPNL